jgi:hypothetical protein
MQRSLHALEWTRTTTGRKAHKALNLARLPIPPRAQRREYSPAVPALSGRIPGVPCCIRPRSTLQCEHMFVTRANPPGQGGNQTWI